LLPRSVIVPLLHENPSSAPVLVCEVPATWPLLFIAVPLLATPPRVDSTVGVSLVHTTASPPALWKQLPRTWPLLLIATAAGMPAAFQPAGTRYRQIPEIPSSRVAARGGRGLLPGRACHHRVMHLRWVAVVAGDHLAESEHPRVPGSRPAARRQVQDAATSRRSCLAVITS
jgi:hypothetical protein